MPAKILDGKRIGAEIRHEVAADVAALAEKGLRPGLAVVLVGYNPASEVYVRNKVRACAETGLHSEKHTPPDDISTEALLDLIGELNRRDDVDGILVQLPLPPQIDEKRILLAIDPAKDVDGFHPLNVGALATGSPALVPCTPAGCMEILQRSDIPTVGQDAVVVGRSNIVGKPMAMLLTNADATVTLCHAHTRDLATACRRADILIVAVGKPGLIRPDMVRPGATVIDVGINRIADRVTFERFFAGSPEREAQFAASGTTLIGDVDPAVVNVAGAVTPVPGGVGPLTIAMLMYNTVKAARLRRGGGHGA